MFTRSLETALRRSKRNVLLLGPRQVGKSTLLRALSPDLVIDLSDHDEFLAYAADPGRLARELALAPRSTRTILLDEVQRVPALLDIVQGLHDRQPDRFRFLVSGSSARKLRRGQANLLPGRVHLHRLHPLVASELGAEFVLERALAHGMLPGIWAEADAATRAADLRSYASTYLREEIQAESILRNVGGYARLLDLIAASSGRIVNVSALGRDAQLSPETVRRYVEILEDTLVGFRIEAWAGSDRARLVRHPRLYLFDLGVRNAILRRPLERPHADERGLLLEHLVAQELFARTDELGPGLRVSYYRTRGGAEVDFVVEVGGELWAVEVKASRNATSGDTTGLRSFASDCGRKHRSLIVFLGERPLRVGAAEAIPVRQFLDELPAPAG